MPTSVVIISGLAGSGKSVAVRALEDVGYYCIDNLPSSMLPSFLDMVVQGHSPHKLVALALDSRDILLPQRFGPFVESLRNHARVEVVFFEARESIVLRRFRETRRMHPLSQNYEDGLGERSLVHAIALDAELLAPLKVLADRVLDTSEMSSHQLRHWMERHYSLQVKENSLIMTIASFGFKYGTPSDFEMIFDVRCFPNPFYDEKLRPLTGLNDPVKNFVLSDSSILIFLEKTVELISFLLPLYVKEGKRYLALGIGCTGGQHRSVVIAEQLALKLRSQVGAIITEHRHIQRQLD